MHFPSDPPIVVPGLDPQHPSAGDPAKSAVASGDWRYAYMLNGKLTCVLPVGAKPTGNVADDNNDRIPASLAAIFAAVGVGETFAYPVYAT